MKITSTVGIVFAAAFALAGCNAPVDFSGVYDGVTTYTFTNCSCTGTGCTSGTSLSTQQEQDEFDISQAGSKVTATAQGAACTMNGDASGDNVSVDAVMQCPAINGQQTTDQSTYSLTYSISGGTFSITDDNLNVDVKGSANYEDQTDSQSIVCDVEITGTLPQTD